MKPTLEEMLARYEAISDRNEQANIATPYPGVTLIAEIRKALEE